MTENSIHRMLNTTYSPAPPRPPATSPAAPPGGGAGTSAMDPAAMKKISTEWSQALRRLADEADFLGHAVTKSAANRQWAEAEIQQRIAQTRVGAH
ncbi:hypothetical protein [Actinomadura opuntiae]|uniref:hypothetical protein n=1 Tax=Actinomadura sp. OS1-43 TaxID=604315 RepID=UPI00255AB9A4|nr:hypothetical protein [Actinomadura sp. OS1-43]MDL4814770.1 hypothetical protein [Actinomadura sp. OS1-43]